MSSAPCPPDSVLVEAFFEDGPLGVTLHRRHDGIIIVYQIVEDSQAVCMDVADGDELWCVGERAIEDSPLDKAAWQDTVDYIRKSERPLRVVFRRRFRDVTEDGDPSTPVAQDASNSNNHHEVPYASASQSPTPQDSRKPSTASEGNSAPSLEAGVESTSSKPSSRAQSTSSPANVSAKTSSRDRSEAGEEGGSQGGRGGGGECDSSDSEGEAGGRRGDREERGEEDEEVDEAQNEELNMRELMAVASTLVLKEKEKERGVFASLIGFKSASANDKSAVQLSQEFLVKPGRRLIAAGMVTVDHKGSLWNSQQQRKLYLFNDILIISIPTTINFQVEHILDLQTCKIADGQAASIIFDHGATMAQAGAAGGLTAKELNELSFVLLSPVGPIRALVRSAEEKKAWFEKLVSAISATVGVEERVVGWQHQIICGTLHSVVLSRDEFKVREFLSAMESGQLEVTSVDALDDTGYSALHYASMLRMHGVIRALRQCNADVTVPDSRGLTALHWAALQLDDVSLTVLCSELFSVDFPDLSGRTPLYLACVEGRDFAGKPDSAALQRCVSCLLNLHADPNEIDTKGMTVLAYVASGWQPESLGALLDVGAEVHFRTGELQSTAIHFCLEARSLRPAVGLAAKIRADRSRSIPGQQQQQQLPLPPQLLSSYASSQSHESRSASRASSHSSTMADILDHRSLFLGEDAEQLVYANGPKSLAALLNYGARPNSKDASGRTPLYILAERDLYWGVYSKDAVLLLLAAGARMDDSSHCTFLRNKFNNGMIEEALEKRAQKAAVNGDLLGLSAGSMEASEIAKISHPQDGKEKCVLCSTSFTLFRRQHHCRLCSCKCCDDCSRKRVVLQGSQQRVCDSCFNVVSYRIDNSLRSGHPSNSQTVGGAASSSSSSAGASSVDERRDQLMTGARPSAANAKTGGGGVGGAAVAGGGGGGGAGGGAAGIAGVQNSMSEAHERLMERGEKLGRLADKSAETARAADEFSKMAKQLNDSQRSRWF